MLIQSRYEETNLNSIKFEKDNLNLNSICQVVNFEKLRFSGYLQFTFDNTLKKLDGSSSNIWFICFSQGKVVFSSCQKINLTNIFKVLKQYLPRLRSLEVKDQTRINQMILLAKKKDDVSIQNLLMELTKEIKLVKYEQIIKAIQTHLLNDFEQHLLNSSGRINIVFDKTVDAQKPIVGFSLEQILLLVKGRRAQWKRLQQTIPSLDLNVKCHEQNPQWQSLPTVQKQKIKKLVNSGNTLEEIGYNLGEDSFKTAQIFAKLLDQKLITVYSNSEVPDLALKNRCSVVEPSKNVSSPKKIAIVDDSLILLKQFKRIVTSWGYEVRCCNDALAAVNFLLTSPPDLIFLDVNMPNLSGFDLIKKIRIQSKLNSIPLVVLTAENTERNNQRARWTKSTFLTKPLNSDDIHVFKSNLKSLLEKMLSANPL